MRLRRVGAGLGSLALAVGAWLWAYPASTAAAVERAVLPRSRAADCQYWIAPNGDNANPGTKSRPWATIRHAAQAVPDRGCTVWLEDGVYEGNSDIERHLDKQTVFRAVHPYQATLEGNGYVLNVSGSTHMTFRGLEIRHSGPGATGIVVYVGGSDTTHLTFRDDIFHDSYDNDVLKILDGAHSVTVHGCVLYNQGNGEQLIDVNSVTNVTIEDSILFNDFEASGRTDTKATKHYIVVKDSNGTDDGIVGSDRITIQRNVFLNWEGGVEAFVAVGNDGKSYFEARDVGIVDNLMIGNGTDQINSAFNVHGAKNVTFANNTVVGDLPSDAFALNVDIKDANPVNQDISFWNNIWSDPTGTMDQFSNGDPSHTDGLTLNNNLYWNGGSRVPGGDLVSPTDDARRVVRDPRLNADQSSIVLPHWTGSSFLDGNDSIRQEFVRLVRTYGAIPGTSPAVGHALRARAPTRDILGRKRDRHPDLGAFEA